ncbi:MAG: TonB-dependent receptor [Melioribacteraceae bacterium]|nr:TonB-dependent receptor [Melioribacteraceae bacterium]MCF8354078.1 TonB-dependent receptor [Melioribacteraceae bacterium]MCF8393750.1 TonB-dependent receptor [Melioribacteraceae bacterium]MCF8419494.1 TonB-dependent receptor [Melioribacteraceae bacterium]
MQIFTNHGLSIYKSTIFLVVILLFILSMPASAQSNGIIEGKITDAASGTSLPGANIVVVGQQIGTAADKSGEYQISLKPGTHTLQVSYVGYKTIKNVIVIEANETIIKNFELETDLTGTSEIVVLGTRRSDRTIIESSVPIDVISAAEIKKSGLTQTTELLKMLVPSYNAPQNTVTDGSDHVKPAAIRGLGPDQVLVLINGKRRHTSALVHLNGSIGRGSTGADLNAIPASAIESIEVLRDGASAQYGSDAIAGVINIVLKKRTGLDVSASMGEYITTMERGYLESEKLIDGQDASTYSWDGNVEDVSIQDGLSTALHAGYGFRVLNTGTIYISGEYRKHNYTNRSGEDPRQQYFTIDGNPDPREETFDRINHRWGDSEVSDIGLFLNSDLPLTDNIQFYSFGGFSYRDGLSGGFYRRASDNRNIRAIYPDGYLPKINAKIYDGSFAAGLKGNIGGWNYDISETFGGNSFNFNVTNSLNASLGAASPTEFDCGTLKFYQSTTNLDLINQFDIGTATPLNVAMGLEFRWEKYQQEAGEPNSYIDGGVPILDGPNAGNSAASGAQVFPGYSPRDVQNESRTNMGIYIDLENDIVSNWTVGAAGRFENYSDFGSTIIGKLSTRYEFLKGFALRGAISTGFRAPSLQQEFYTSIATVFINGEPFEVGTFPVASAAAKALGAEDLKAEKSVNLSAGATYSMANFSLTVDAYQISVNDRIGLTENFRGGSIDSLLLSKGIQATGGRYFINALNTKTKGLDITSSYGIRLGNESSLKLTLAMNFNETEVTNEDEIQTPAELTAVTDIPLQSRATLGRLTVGYPKSSWNFMTNYNWNNFGFMLRILRYGEFTSLHTTDPTRDQTRKPVWITDIELSYDITEGIELAVGSNNLLDVYPEKNLKVSAFNGIFQYSGFSPSGYNGRYVYTRLNVSL